MYAIGENSKVVEAHENRNFARGEKKTYSLGEKERKKIERFNAADMNLYEAAGDKFEQLQKRYGGGY